MYGKRLGFEFMYTDSPSLSRSMDQARANQEARTEAKFAELGSPAAHPAVVSWLRQTNAFGVADTRGSVTSNRALDYFGRTVHIAARVQGWASAGEVLVTAELLDDPTVAEALRPLPVTVGAARSSLRASAAHSGSLSCSSAVRA